MSLEVLGTDNQNLFNQASKICSFRSLTGHFIVEYQRLEVILGAAVMEQDYTSQYVEQKLLEQIGLCH